LFLFTYFGSFLRLLAFIYFPQIYLGEGKEESNAAQLGEHGGELLVAGEAPLCGPPPAGSAICPVAAACIGTK
jgi:hypothetical protein